MLFNKIDELVNCALIWRDIERYTDKYQNEEINNRYLFELLKDIDPVQYIAVMDLPKTVQTACCIAYLLFDILLKIADESKIDSSEKAAQLQKISTLLHTLDEDEIRSSDIMVWGFDLILVSLKLSLPFYQRDIIIIEASKAALGMADFCGKELYKLSDYTLLCHYRRGCLIQTLVGLLSHEDEKIEKPLLANVEHLSGSVGIFIEKVYRINRPERASWPKEIWEIYTNFDINTLCGKSMMNCRNNLILDAAKHIPEIYQFLCLLERQITFKIIASQALVAIRLLFNFYNNPKTTTLGFCRQQQKLFSIGSSYTIYKYLESLADFQEILYHKVEKISKLTRIDDPTSGQMRLLISQLEVLCGKRKNRLLGQKDWILSIGMIIELLLYGLLGLMMTLLLIKLYK